uniref:alpha-1,6-mannosyl-glycoprotein 6-beta-N-acetylglucosaminyltransferase n=1 Tax=Macrostomum lignano TaxID=282301 RepID=A0A1I8HYR8_9PLAT
HLLRQNESVAWVNRRQQLDNGAVARESARLSLLEQLAGAPGLRERVNQRWQSLASAAVEGGWPDRWPRRRVLAHVGYLSQPQHWPPAEAAQWADLLAGVGLLGHRLTVSIDGVGLRRQLLKLNYAKTECQGKRDSVITHLVTDLVGILQVRSVLGKSFARFACLYRILAPFGVEPKFNDQSFSSSNELNTPVSGLDLSPMQYLSWLPFTLENFYLGLALPPPALPNMTNLPSRVELFIFGFGNSVWKDAAFYLAELRKHFRRIHTAVSPEQHPDVPAYVVNHGLLNYTQYRGLLMSMVSNGGGIFVGLGFPYEHPAPLEAASLGLPFLNLRFKPPLDRTNSDYLREIPVSRKLRSQDPYLESLGEPASFLVDLEAKHLIPATLARGSRGSRRRLRQRELQRAKRFHAGRLSGPSSSPLLGAVSCRVAPLDDLSTSSWAAVRNSTDVATAAAAAAAAASAYSGGADVLFYLGIEGRSCSETCLSASKRSVCAPDQMR